MEEAKVVSPVEKIYNEFKVAEKKSEEKKEFEEKRKYYTRKIVYEGGTILVLTGFVALIIYVNNYLPYVAPSMLLAGGFFMLVAKIFEWKDQKKKKEARE